MSIFAFSAACTKKSTLKPEIPGIVPSDIPTSGSPFSSIKLIVSNTSTDVSVVVDVKISQESLATNLPAALHAAFTQGLARLNPRGTEAEMPVEFALRVKNPGSETLKAWQQFVGVVGISDQVNGYTMLSNDPSFADQKAIQTPFLNLEPMVDQLESELNDKKDTPVVVAIIDSGADLANADVPLVADLTGTNIVEGENANRPQDDLGHGSRLASIVAATRGNGNGIAGVGSRGTRILPIRAFNSRGESSTTLLVNAIYRAVNIGADVILIAANSETKGCDAALGHAISRANDKGSVVIMAAGNSGRRAIDARRYAIDDLRYFSPGCWGSYTSGAITVGSTLGSNRNSDRFAFFSNYGEGVEVSAPGTSIVSTTLGGSVQSGDGTSYSAALAAGIATHVVSYLKAKDWLELHGTSRHLIPQYVETILMTGAYRNANTSVESDAKVLTLDRLPSHLRTWDSATETVRLSQLDNPRNKESWDTLQGGKFLTGSQHAVFEKVFLSPGQRSAYRMYVVDLATGNPIDVTDITRCASDVSWAQMSEYGEMATSPTLADYSTTKVNIANIVCRVEPTRWQKMEYTIQLVVDSSEKKYPRGMTIAPPKSLGKEFQLFEAFATIEFVGKGEHTVKLPAKFTFQPEGFIPTISPALFNVSGLPGGTPVTMTAKYHPFTTVDAYTLAKEAPFEIEIQAYLGATVVEGQTPKFQAEIKNPGNNDVVLPIKATWYLDGNLVGGSPSYTLSLPNLPRGTHVVEAKYSSLLTGELTLVTANYAFTVVGLVDGVSSFSLLVERAFANRATQIFGLAEYESRAIKAVTEETLFSVAPNDGLATVSKNGTFVVSSEAAVSKTYIVTGVYAGKAASVSIKPTRLDISTGNVLGDRVLSIEGPDEIPYAEEGHYRVFEKLGEKVKQIRAEYVSFSTSNPEIAINENGSVYLRCEVQAGITFDIVVIYDGLRVTKTVRIPLRGAITAGSLFQGEKLVGSDWVIDANSDMGLSTATPMVNIANEIAYGKKVFRRYWCIQGRYRVDPPTGLTLIRPGSTDPITTTEKLHTVNFNANNSKAGTYTIYFDGDGYLGNGPSTRIQFSDRITIRKDTLLSLEVLGEVDGAHSSRSFSFYGHYSSAPDQLRLIPLSSFDVTLLNGDRTPATTLRYREWSGIHLWGAKMYNSRTQINDSYIIKLVHKETKMTKEVPITMRGTNHFNLPAVGACPAFPAIVAKTANPQCTVQSEKVLPVAAGNGTPESPYLICSKEQLMSALSADSSDRCQPGKCRYQLGKNIDLGSIENFEPLQANKNRWEEWEFNGDGYTISNLTQLSPEGESLGLFSQCAYVRISKLIISNPNILGNNYVGALCGTSSYSTLEDIFVTGGSVGGNRYVGGITGSLVEATARRIFNYNTEIRVRQTTGGGLIGYQQYMASTLQDSLSSASVLGVGPGSSDLGGLVGDLEVPLSGGGSPYVISSPQDFSTTEKINGFANIARSCWLGSGKRIDAGQGNVVGGIVGKNVNGILFNAVADGGNLGATLIGSMLVGGLAGGNESSLTYARAGAILNSTAKNLRIIGSTSVGGFVGGMSTSILQKNDSINCRIEATNGSSVGGFIGSLNISDPWGLNRAIVLDATVTNTVYNTGSQTGGFIGSVSYTPGYAWLFELFLGNRWRQAAALPDIGSYSNGTAPTLNMNYNDAGVRLW